MKLQRDSENADSGWIVGGGEMGNLVRSMDWSETPLGSIESWPQSLRTTVNICLASDLPICIIWGPGSVQIYNDGYRVICGGKHPKSMGQNFSKCWSEAWSVIGEAHDSALAGDTAFLEDQHIFLDRHGYNEECFFTFSFSPIRGDDGHIGGLFHPVIEMTAKVLGERRTRTLRDLATFAGKAKSISEALTLSSQTLAQYKRDLPFVLIYLLDRTAQQARLASSMGLPAASDACALIVDLLAPGELSWPLGAVALSGLTLQVDDLQQRFGALRCTAYPEEVQTALMLPITPPGMDQSLAVLVVGVSPRLALDEMYRGFYELLAAAVTSAIANACAHEQEIKRAEALAALDRAKTDFFSNVSHEFRTPLTLLLGPTEELLAMSHLPRGVQAQIGMVHRNALRLQKLVNTLLDFSRIEAGRALASYQATDLGAFSGELASVFRSAVENAGMRLVVNCPQLAEAVYVDRDMWEKIVLNLISNAFKFTFEGAITIALKDAGHAVQLSVRDTGAGIVAAQLPHIFERFHRVEAVRARTREGTGIGLALVQELVRLHGGTVGVESDLGRGSTFTVTIPKGSSHLSADRVSPGGGQAPTSLSANRFALEALRWLPVEDAVVSMDSVPSSLAPGFSDNRQRILLVDDDADMRLYLSRLLGERYAVQTAPDGETALAAARSNPPDLVLSDVMMPRLDGLGMLAQLRADPATRSMPVILLSARAGEESRVEGLELGADDYMVKPFNARELLARVGGQLQMAQLRREANLSLLESEARLRAFVTASSDVVYRMSPDWIEMRQLDGHDFVADTKEPRSGWIDEYIFPDDQPRVLEAIRQAIHTQTLFELEHRVRRVDGTLGWTSSRAIPLLNGKGDIVEWFGTASDISQRKEAEEAARLSALELAQADRRKNEFLAMLAHELRNPLAPIRNALHIMRRTDGSAGAQAASAMMERQINQMTRLVDDLLDVSRISRGNIELRKEQVELAAAVQHAVEAARPFCELMEHELTVTLPQRAVYLNADPTRLAQIIGNLLHNACKFTDKGGRIAIVLERDGQAAAIRVRDSGVGLAPEQFVGIFEMFTQIDTSLERSRGGLGIGLTLVKSLVEMHGGTVQVHSRGINHGSEFVVRLPLLADVPQQTLSQPVLTGSVQGRRILVVDDNRDAATSLAELLELSGYETRIAHDGLEAVEAAESFCPEVVLLDIGLPKLNGLEAARTIREQPWGRDMVLVALTGWGQDEDRRQSSEAGFNVHLVKPVDPVLLMELLTRMQSHTT